MKARPLALALGIGLAAACEGGSDPGAHPAPSAQAAGAEASAAPSESVEAPPKAGFEAELAAVDRKLRGLEKKAAARADDWLHLELVARGYVERARLSGDYADYKKAEDALEEAFRRAPKGSGPFLTRAALHFTLHRLPPALADVAAVERFAIASPDERLAALSLRADVAFHAGRYADAKKGYEAWLEAGRTPAALAAMAQFLWKTGERERAASLLEEAETKGKGSPPPLRAWLRLLRGLHALDGNALDEALGHFRRGLSVLPGYWLLEEHVAEVLARKGLKDEALAAYLDLIERTGNPEFMDAAAAIYAEKSDGANAARLRDSARKVHESRLRLFPEAAAAHALDHFLASDASRAPDDARRAVELAEKNRDARPGGEAMTKLAEAYLHAGRVADARKVVEATRKTPWDTADLHAVAARVFEASGLPARAATERARAEAIAPGSTLR